MDDTATRIAYLIRGSVNRQITMSEVLEKVQGQELAERCTQETIDELISFVQFTWGAGGTYRDFLIRVFSVYAESVQNAGRPAEACRLLDAAEMMRKRLAEAAIRSFEQAINANDTPQLAAAARRLWEVAIPETMETREQAIDTMLLARRVGEELRRREMFLQAVPFHHVLCKASMGTGIVEGQRSPSSCDLKRIDDPLLQTQRLLQGILRSTSCSVLPSALQLKVGTPGHECLSTVAAFDGRLRGGCHLDRVAPCVVRRRGCPNQSATGPD